MQFRGRVPRRLLSMVGIIPKFKICKLQIWVFGDPQQKIIKRNIVEECVLVVIELQYPFLINEHKTCYDFSSYIDPEKIP